MGVASTVVALSAACTPRGSAIPSVLPPRTIPVTPVAAISCPPHAPRAIPAHQRPGTTVIEVPGHPVSLLACRYHGLNQPQTAGTLATSAVFPPSTIAAELNDEPTVDPNVFACPIDFGETVLLIFGYANGPPILVDINTAGCQFASNGDRTIRTPIIGQLEDVLGHDER
jgi:hypothetical protein